MPFALTQEDFPVIANQSIFTQGEEAQLEPCTGGPVVRGNIDSNIIVSADCKQAEVVKPGFSIDAVDKHGNLLLYK